MRRLCRKIYHRLPTDYREKIKRHYYVLRKMYATLKLNVVWYFAGKNKVNNIDLFESRIYSQNGEDGIIKMIFRKIETTNRFCVEFGVGDGYECNTRSLIEEGWNYLHMDGGSYSHSDTNIQKEFITAENINHLFKKYNVPSEFDLLSIDIDYNTYWVWRAIDAKYRPRVVVIEYNASIPPNESKAVLYDPHAVWDRTNYFGASLLALVKLGKSKGYTLVGCESRGVNAFFVRDDLVSSFFEIKDIEEIYKKPGYGKKVNGRFIGHPPSNKSFITV